MQRPVAVERPVAVDRPVQRPVTRPPVFEQPAFPQWPAYGAPWSWPYPQNPIIFVEEEPEEPAKNETAKTEPKKSPIKINPTTVKTEEPEKPKEQTVKLTPTDVDTSSTDTPADTTTSTTPTDNTNTGGVKDSGDAITIGRRLRRRR